MRKASTDLLPVISKEREMELDRCLPSPLLSQPQGRKQSHLPARHCSAPRTPHYSYLRTKCRREKYHPENCGIITTHAAKRAIDPRARTVRVCFFGQIITDIGDNQSIENHLSTYSYRLKNMKYFLRKCNDKTLFLIDEFGTGSDPELGGALAEAFLEEFYNREAYGIITTHYSNLKSIGQ